MCIRDRHNDDYRGKIVHDKDRFQDKVHEKVSKRSAETELNGKTSKRNARYRACLLYTSCIRDRSTPIFYGEFKNVRLSKEEYKNLKEKLNSHTEIMINKLSLSLIHI